MRIWVIKLDMSGGSDSVGALRANLKSNLLYTARRLGLELPATDEPAIFFQELIQEAHKQYGRQVVLLIDEYDKPMIDNIDDMELAEQMRK